MSKTQLLKRTLYKIKKKETKAKSILTKNLLKNHTCDTCKCELVAEWATYRKDVGQAFCSNYLHTKFFKTDKLPKENTCRFWIEKA
jgi:hypothetical protein